MVGVAKVSVPAEERRSMNGVHGMDGMQCMGPIVYEKSERVFHERWPGPDGSPLSRDRSMAHVERSMLRAVNATFIPPAEYPRNS